jgi:hypothetical protein
MVTPGLDWARGRTMLRMIAPGFCLERAVENERRAEQCADERQRAAWLEAAAYWRSAHQDLSQRPAPEARPKG